MRWVLRQLRARPWLVGVALVAAAPALVMALLLRGQHETIERQRAQLDRLEQITTASCLLYAVRALQDLPGSECLIQAAAATVDVGGCLPRPVRPDLDTTPEALDACLADLAERVGGGGG